MAICHCLGGRLDDDGPESFIRSIQEVFLNGDLRDLVEFVTMPMVVYTKAGVTVVRSERQLLSVLRGYRKAVAEMGVASGTITIEERDAPTNQRVCVLVSSSYRLQDGSVVPGSRIRLFLLRDGDGFKLEMLEFLESPFSLSEVERIVH